MNNYALQCVGYGTIGLGLGTLSAAGSLGLTMSILGGIFMLHFTFSEYRNQKV